MSDFVFFSFFPLGPFRGVVEFFCFCLMGFWFWFFFSFFGWLGRFRKFVSPSWKWEDEGGKQHLNHTMQLG